MNRLKGLKRALVLFLSMSVLSLAFASSDPVAELSGTADQMIAALKTNQSQIKTQPSLVEDLARNILLPQVNVQLMAKLALGRNAWNAATPDQQTAFTAAFTTLMIRTYASAFAAYTDEQVKFYPLRPGEIDGDRVQVKSDVLQSGGPAIPVNYRLLSNNGDWQVYDINVDGVSLIQSFRSQFANELNQGGMDQLLTALNQHNAEMKK